VLAIRHATETGQRRPPHAILKRTNALGFLHVGSRDRVVRATRGMLRLIGPAIAVVRGAQHDRD